MRSNIFYVAMVGADADVDVSVRVGFDDLVLHDTR